MCVCGLNKKWHWDSGSAELFFIFYVMSNELSQLKRITFAPQWGGLALFLRFVLFRVNLLTTLAIWATCWRVCFSWMVIHIILGREQLHLISCHLSDLRECLRDLMTEKFFNRIIWHNKRFQTACIESLGENMIT